MNPYTLLDGLGRDDLLSIHDEGEEWETTGVLPQDGLVARKTDEARADLGRAGVSIGVARTMLVHEARRRLINVLLRGELEDTSD